MNNQSIESITKITNDLFALLDIIEQPPIYNSLINYLFNCNNFVMNLKMILKI